MKNFKSMCQKKILIFCEELQKKKSFETLNPIKCINKINKSE